jgi:hypothetical protein
MDQIHRGGQVPELIVISVIGKYRHPTDGPHSRPQKQHDTSSFRLVRLVLRLLSFVLGFGNLSFAKNLEWRDEIRISKSEIRNNIEISKFKTKTFYDLVF